MIWEEILLFGILGVLTSVIMGMIVTEAKNVKLLLFLIVEGVFFGWLSGALWIYLTGGLDIPLMALIVPIFVTAFFTTVFLTFVPEQIWRSSFSVPTKTTTNISIALIFILCFVVAFTALPVEHPSLLADTTMDYSTEWTGQVRVYQNAEVSPMNEISQETASLEFEAETSSISGMQMMENARQGEYLNFKVGMTVKDEDWNMPYITVAVFEDKDGNGQLSEGDLLWSDADFKITPSDENWKVNCVWENNKPTYSACIGKDELLPIFHTNTITTWKNEQNKKFKDTPEGFTPESDMVSWEKTNDTITLKEQIISYATISVGESTTIEGRIYCGVPAGKDNYVIIQAYDAMYSSPDNPVKESIGTKVIPFEVTEEQQKIGGEWYILGALGLILVIGIAVQRRKKMF